MKKLLILVSLLSTVWCAAPAFAVDQAIKERYAKTCALCHSNGAAGAPKTGSAEQWAPRMEKGMDTLVNNAKNGINAMPPKGMCFDCTDAQFQALIEYMVTGK